MTLEAEDGTLLAESRVGLLDAMLASEQMLTLRATSQSAAVLYWLLESPFDDETDGSDK